MARLPRYVMPGHPQHVIVRGNNRMPIFCADEDYRFYLEKLKQACDKHDCSIHAYVLMTNHVHLLITPQTEHGISKVMQMLGRYYVQYFNHTYQRTGTLWEGRYKATLIDSERYLLTCYRYIELNPVRAEGMVDHPGEYRWSSYRANALGEADALLKPHPLYLALGTSSLARQASYRALFDTHVEEHSLLAIRESLNQCRVLGSDIFKDQIEDALKRSVRPGNPGRPKKIQPDPN